MRYGQQSTQRDGKTVVDIQGGFTPEQILRLTRLGRELRLTNQILSVDVDSLTIIQDGPAPAWTTLDGDAITFAMKFMPKPVERIDVAVWLGTNAHELGHVLFSPRRHSRLMQRVIEGDRTFLPGLAQLCNIVEDQRQERLLLAMFSPWSAYLTAALSHHLKADSETAWLLMCGRTWLPASVRSDARSRFVAQWGEASTVEVAQIVGEYQSLLDPGDSESDEAWELLVRLHNIFDTRMPGLPRSCTVMTGGEPMTGEPGEGAPATAGEAEAQDGDGEGEGSGDESGDDGEGDSTGSGAGSKPAPLTANEIQRKVRKDLRDAAKAELDEDNSDIDAVLDALKHGRAGDEAEGAVPIGSYDVASDTARRLHHEVGDALLDLKDESEPGWRKRTDSGRLNVRRLANPFADADELFDRYEPGQMDASEMELVLLLDVSGSMQSQTYRLSECAWAIRHAVDDIEGRATVITFDSGPHRIMAEAGQRPDDRMFVLQAIGGTEPTSALGEAYRILADSPARNRLMVCLTDGDFYGDYSHDVIRAMRDGGIVTIMALLGRPGFLASYHGCEYGAAMDDVFDLARLFRRVAAERIGAWR